MLPVMDFVQPMTAGLTNWPNPPNAVISAIPPALETGLRKLGGSVQNTTKPPYDAAAAIIISTTAKEMLCAANGNREKQAAITNAGPKNISLAALNRLLLHSWPGNVRELQNVLMRAIVLSDHHEIELSDLNLPEDGHPVEDQSFQTMKSRVVWQFEHDFLETALRAHNGNISRAASAVKKNRRAFWELLRKHGLLDRAKMIELGMLSFLSLGQDFLVG